MRHRCEPDVEAYSAGSWRCSPVRTIHVRLDHGGPTVVLGGGVRVPASGARRRRAPWSARSSGNRRARHLTREHVCQSDVLEGQVTCSRAGARHDMRDAVPPCEMCYRGEAGTGCQNRPRCRPDRLRRSPRPIPPRPPPTHPEATRVDRHGRPPRPTALNDPSRHTRESHSDALATALRTRRTRPSRPPPRPSRPTPSKPPLNNLQASVLDILG